jgi:hypothetical protein
MPLKRRLGSHRRPPEDVAQHTPPYTPNPRAMRITKSYTQPAISKRHKLPIYSRRVSRLDLSSSIRRWLRREAANFDSCIADIVRVTSGPTGIAITPLNAHRGVRNCSTS